MIVKIVTASNQRQVTVFSLYKLLETESDYAKNG